VLLAPNADIVVAVRRGVVVAVARPQVDFFRMQHGGDPDHAVFGARTNALLDRALEAGQREELDETTRRALDQPRVDYATLMSELANS